MLHLAAAHVHLGKHVLLLLLLGHLLHAELLLWLLDAHLRHLLLLAHEVVLAHLVHVHSHLRLLLLLHVIEHHVLLLLLLLRELLLLLLHHWVEASILTHWLAGALVLYYAAHWRHLLLLLLWLAAKALVSTTKATGTTKGCSTAKIHRRLLLIRTPKRIKGVILSCVQQAAFRINPIGVLLLLFHLLLLLNLLLLLLH